MRNLWGTKDKVKERDTCEACEDLKEGAPQSASSIIGTTERGEKGEGWPRLLKSLKTKLWEKKGTSWATGKLLERPVSVVQRESNPSGGSNLEWRRDKTL